MKARLETDEEVDIREATDGTENTSRRQVEEHIAEVSGLSAVLSQNDLRKLIVIDT